MQASSRKGLAAAAADCIYHPVQMYLLQALQWQLLLIGQEAGARSISDHIHTQVCTFLELAPGDTVLESGTGSGSLTTSLARAVGPRGCVRTFEYHQVGCDGRSKRLLAIFSTLDASLMQHPSRVKPLKHHSGAVLFCCAAPIAGCLLLASMQQLMHETLRRAGSLRWTEGQARAEAAAAEFQQNGLSSTVMVGHRDIEALGFPEQHHGTAQVKYKVGRLCKQALDVRPDATVSA